MCLITFVHLRLWWSEAVAGDNIYAFVYFYGVRIICGHPMLFVNFIFNVFSLSILVSS